jgi:hypothetical protein
MNCILGYVLSGVNESIHVCSSKVRKRLTVSVILASAPARTKHLRMSVEPSMAAIIKGVSLPIPSTSAPA